MRIPVRNKLVATYLLISLFTALLIYGLTYFTSEPRINALVKDYQNREMVQEIAHWYAAEHQWEGFPDYFKSLHPPPPKSEMEEEASAESVNTSKRHGIVTSERRVLLRYLNYKPGEIIPEVYLSNAIPVMHKGKTVAWLIPPEVTGINLNSELQVFLDNIFEVLLIAICIGVLVSFFMGMLLARLFLKPVESLTRATSAIARGDLEQNVPTFSDDEIGDLSRSFNKMSQDLAEADMQRRQLTADITHDLGTPVQVISGYIEMAQDGMLELNSDRLETISDELNHIQRLLKDMTLLAETDSKALSLQLGQTDILPLLEKVVRLYEQSCREKQITLSLQTDDSLPEIELDEDRMVQVLGNLISNAMRYTPPNGEISIRSAYRDRHLTISVTDNGSGIDPQDLPYIFDRFYRSDNARSGETGKMGLGLAISKGLIEMQGGQIRVESDGKTGSCFTLSFSVTLADKVN